jgi:ubiquitin-conjugating enzyme E2 J2
LIFLYHKQAVPLENDILIFHYVIEGPPDTPYAHGFYHGVLKFPSEYPLKPPTIIMYTPSGRFETGKPICTSFSSFHPETWNPTWSVSSILMGLLSFMAEESDSVGSMRVSNEQRLELAAKSLGWNIEVRKYRVCIRPNIILIRIPPFFTMQTNKDFRKMFPELVEVHESRLKLFKQMEEEKQVQNATSGVNSVQNDIPGGVQSSPKRSACGSFSILSQLGLILLALLLSYYVSTQK